MPFISPPYMAGLDADRRRSLASIGYHPETHDELFIPNLDRYPGMYMLGVQGSGKSALLQNLVTADIQAGTADIQAGNAVIVIDPHGDLVTACLSHVPAQRLGDTFLLDMEDEAYPFGINLFNTTKFKTSLERAQAVERNMHIFEVLWPEVTHQQYVPLYLPNAVQVFLDNPGKTLVDMLRFFQDDGFRAGLLRNVTDPAIRQFWYSEYDNLSKSERDQKIKALTNRLHTLFTGNNLVRNIIRQPWTTINFRKTIEAKQIIFIKLPTTTIPHVARLIGTILLAQIEAALFSFADIPEDRRPGVSLYIDEFQNFATKDIEKLFTQGRKFGMRLTVAHQQRDQLPSFLQASTMTARNTICFRLTPEDGREMAHLFPSNEATVQPEDINPHPAHYLLTKTPDDPVIQIFTEVYLRKLQGYKRGNRVEIYQRGAPSLYDIINGGRSENPRIADPTPFLDSLLYQVMCSGNPSLPIPPEAVQGFANCGRGFYKQAMGLTHSDPLLQAGAKFPRHLVVQAANGEFKWTRKPEGGTEQLFHLVFHLRLVMQRLAEQPIGKATTLSHTDVGRMLTALPKRAAFVRSGDTVGVIYTHDTAPGLANWELYERAKDILEHTRIVYCHPREEVERLFMQPAHPQAGIQPVKAEEIE